jgi:AcrR family transcriptional regulator
MRKRALSAQTGKGRPRSSAADRAILRAALLLFIEHGIHGVGIEQVAETAGVARTTVYRRWSSKEALISAAIAEHRGSSDERALKRRTSPPAMLAEVTDALVDTLTTPDYEKIVARLIGSVSDYPELMSTYWENCLLPRRHAAAAVLQRARAAGLLRRDTDPEILLDLITGAIMHHILVRQGERSKNEIREYVTKIFHAIGLRQAKEQHELDVIETKRGRP